MRRLTLRFVLASTLLALPIVALAQPAQEPAAGIDPAAKALLTKMFDRCETSLLDLVGASQEISLVGTSRANFQLALDVPGRLRQPVGLNVAVVASVLDKKNLRVSVSGDLVEGDIYVKDGKSVLYLKGANVYCDDVPTEERGGEKTPVDLAAAQAQVKEGFAQIRAALEQPSGLNISIVGSASPEGVPAKVLFIGPPGEKKDEGGRLTLREADGLPTSLEVIAKGQKFLTVGLLYKGKDLPVETEGRMVPIEKDMPNLMFKVELGKDARNRFNKAAATFTMEQEQRDRKVRVGATLAFDADYDKMPQPADLQFTPPAGAQKLSAKDFGKKVQEAMKPKLDSIENAVEGRGDAPAR